MGINQLYVLGVTFYFLLYHSQFHAASQPRYSTPTRLARVASVRIADLHLPPLNKAVEPKCLAARSVRSTRACWFLPLPVLRLVALAIEYTYKNSVIPTASNRHRAKYHVDILLLKNSHWQSGWNVCLSCTSLSPKMRLRNWLSSTFRAVRTVVRKEGGIWCKVSLYCAKLLLAGYLIFSGKRGTTLTTKLPKYYGSRQNCC